MRQQRKIKNVNRNYAFVVDGETEAWYLQMMKRNEQELRINIVPRIPQKKSIKQQFDLVKELSVNHTKVFWIIDLDVVVKESKTSPKGKNKSIKVFNECRNTLLNKYKNVSIIVNNPCLEFWFLLHFTQTSRLFENCIDVEKLLKKELKDYQKNEKYFTKENNDIYKRLKPKMQLAICNAELLRSFEENNDPERAICEMHLIFKTTEFAVCCATN